MRKKIVKEIKVDVDKCTGCLACEIACSAFHASPRYSSVNPARSRIVVVMDETRDLFVPTRAGEHLKAQCSGRNLYILEGKEYDECSFCPASCPSRDYFKEPDSGNPYKCDMCENTPPLPEPMCVQACGPGALTYLEREEEVEEDEETAELEVGLDTLIDRHGIKEVAEAAARLSKR